ncbi:HAMP domain-containing sensor histidine kinase [Nitrososphaera sp.]|uniref:sensor histidine kinase n=1 Tax=Nitrososphaera sp. TaxID=1971748 RepID=UPI0017CA9DF2|nr:HAMP domain-containing sensor histidine kinase [Nitrososphaera sp.]NWG37707.1 sensor histidine kinase [Nitrososphaera sp.]
MAILGSKTPKKIRIRNPIGSSLHTQVVVLVMATSILSIAGLATISIDIGQKIIKDDAAQRMNVIASDRMQTLKNVWNLRVEQAESLARNPNVVSLLQPSTQTSSEQAARETVADFEALTKGRDATYVEVRISDSQGLVLVAGDPAQEGTVLSREMMARASQRSYYAIGSVDSSSAALFVAAAPVRPQSDSPVAGYVVLLRDLNDANRLLADKMFLGATGENYLVNNAGLMITDSRFVAGARNSQIVDTPPVQECFRNSADVNGASYPSYRGVTVFGASSCEKSLGVVLVSEVDSAELFGPLVLLQNQYLLITAVIIFAAAGASFFLSVSILKPLQSLRKTMGHVQTGRFEKVDIERRDEIGELANSFNTMVEEIGIKTKRLHLKNDILSFMSSRLQVQADELIKADREKEEFSEMISHELKTFLVPIIGYSELLLDGTFGELTVPQKNQLKVVLEKAWSLLYLTQNIIDARQLEYGVLKMKMSAQVSAKKLVEECVSRSLPLAKLYALDIVSDADDVYFVCDQQRILQVLDNLVNNAIKATKESNHRMIEVSATKRDDHVLFSVKDNGIGIPEGKQRDLFKKFYQIDKSLTRQAGGSGLGLIISKGIVESHAGKIWFESKPGAGSTFYFSIPMTVQNSTAGR